MKRILLLLAFDLCLLISPFGGADLFIPATKALAQKTYHAAMNIGHTSVSAVKSSIERTANRKSVEEEGKSWKRIRT